MADAAARTLIVNADDFGLTAGVSRGILDAHARGIVTSTTLMVNGPNDHRLEPALLEELQSSGLGVGLHVNLTLGVPLSDPRRIPSLLDPEGRFVRDAGQVAARASADEARLEIGNQIDAFRELMGRFPTHLDSHHHVGAHGPLLELMLFFARALKVPLRAVDADTRAAARREKLRTPDHFMGESGPEPYWTAERVLEHLQALPAGVSEFMTHPGYFDGDLAYSRYGRQRDVELAGLTDPRGRELIAREGIRLAHYGALAGEASRGAPGAAATNRRPREPHGRKAD
ncbi:MAG TPA: ChbG/HpnK family deacetylase [Vicinamibacteria bacterium]|nr:ChbG/HpnK family deacetylase [Vicinamibacteria bacterium]